MTLFPTPIVVSKQIFSWNCFKNNDIFFHLPPTSSHPQPLQVENCGSNSRLVVDEDDNGKFRLERVKSYYMKGVIDEDIEFMVLLGSKSHFVQHRSRLKHPTTTHGIRTSDQAIALISQSKNADRS